jgi:hypothetical protein
MLTSNITVRTVEKEFSITIKQRPCAGRATYFFDGHIDDTMNLEEAFRLIREAIGKITALV